MDLSFAQCGTKPQRITRRLRTVLLGGQDAERVEIVSGIEPGEKVVISGVFALKSEIFR